MRRFAEIIFLVAALACAALHAEPILILGPASGNLLGDPGQIVGWSFTIQNDSNYLVVTSADYVTLTGVGTFTDFISFYNFVVVGPDPESPSVSQLFNNVDHTGVGSYLIDPGATPGALSTGTVSILYDLYSTSPNDPAFDPNTLIHSGTLEAPASVQVNGTVPEASPGWTFAAGSLLLLCTRLRRVRRS